MSVIRIFTQSRGRFAGRAQNLTVPEGTPIDTIAQRRALAATRRGFIAEDTNYVGDTTDMTQATGFLPFYYSTTIEVDGVEKLQISDPVLTPEIRGKLASKTALYFDYEQVNSQIARKNTKAIDTIIDLFLANASQGVPAAQQALRLLAELVSLRKGREVTDATHDKITRISRAAKEEIHQVTRFSQLHKIWFGDVDRAVNLYASALRDSRDIQEVVYLQEDSLVMFLPALLYENLRDDKVYISVGDEAQERGIISTLSVGNSSQVLAQGAKLSVQELNASAINPITVTINTLPSDIREPIFRILNNTPNNIYFGGQLITAYDDIFVHNNDIPNGPTPQFAISQISPSS